MKKYVSLSVMLLFLSGCKLSLLVSTGGDVLSSDPEYSCVGGKVCEVEISEATFNETFRAIPRPGYVFSKWAGGTNFHLCAESTDPVCAVSNLQLAGSGAESKIPLGYIFYAIPLFDFVGIDTDGDGLVDHQDLDDDGDGVHDVDDCHSLDSNNSTNCDILYVNGREWYQPDLFADSDVELSWNVLQDMCPNGGCRSAHQLSL